MFADLDDPTPPTADDAVRRRVDARTVAVGNRSRRKRQRTRVGLIVAVAAFALLVGIVAVSARSRSDHAAPVTPTGEVVATWPFVGQPSVTDQQATVDRLNQRFQAAALPVTAWLQADHVVVTVAAGQTARPEVLTAIAQPGQVEFRPVIEAPDALGHLTRSPAPGSGQILVPSTVDPSRRGPSDRYLLGPEVVDGSAVESVTSGQDSRGQWEVRPVLRAGADGIDAFNALAALCFERAPSCPGLPDDPRAIDPYTLGGGQIAVVLDDAVLVAPAIEVASFERDQITISANFDQAQARLIAAMLTSGVLPAPLDLTSG